MAYCLESRNLRTAVYICSGGALNNLRGALFALHTLWMIALSCSIYNLQSSEQWCWEISINLRNMSEQCGLGQHSVLGADHPGQGLPTQQNKSRCVKQYGWSEWQEVCWGGGLRCMLWNWAWLSIWWFLLCEWDSFSSLEDMGLLSQSNLIVGLWRPCGLIPEYRIMEWTWESRLWNVIAGLSLHACVVLSIFLIYSMRMLVI